MNTKDRALREGSILDAQYLVSDSGPVATSVRRSRPAVVILPPLGRAASTESLSSEGSCWSDWGSAGYIKKQMAVSSETNLYVGASRGALSRSTSYASSCTRASTQDQDSTPSSDARVVPEFQQHTSSLYC